MSAADVANGKVDSQALGSAIVSSLEEKIAAASDDGSEAVYTVTLTEETAMAVSSGAFQLVDAQGNANPFIVAAFKESIQRASCVGLQGTCIVVLPALERRRRLQSSSETSGAIVNLTLTREFDYAQSNMSVSASDLVQQAGMEVAAAQTTGLSAATTVTVLGDSGSSNMADAVGGQQLGASLAQKYPSLVLEITSVMVAPPTAPPDLPPQLPLPPGAPPIPPGDPPAPASSSSGSNDDTHVGVALLAVLCALLLVAILLVRARIRRRSGSKGQSSFHNAGSTTTLTTVVPSGKAEAGTSCSPPQSRPSSRMPSGFADSGTSCSPPQSRSSHRPLSHGSLSAVLRPTTPRSFLPRRRVPLQDGSVATMVGPAGSWTSQPGDRNASVEARFGRDEAMPASMARSYSRDAWMQSSADHVPFGAQARTIGMPHTSTTGAARRAPSLLASVVSQDLAVTEFDGQLDDDVRAADAARSTVLSAIGVPKMRLAPSTDAYSGAGNVVANGVGTDAATAAGVGPPSLTPSRADDLRVRAQQRLTELQAAQQRLQQLQATRRTRAPMVAARFAVAAQRAGSDRVLPPQRHERGTDSHNDAGEAHSGQQQ